MSQTGSACEVEFKIVSQHCVRVQFHIATRRDMGIRNHLAAMLVAVLSVLATLHIAAQTTPASGSKTNNGQTPVQPLLGQGWGVDHVGVGVRDLAQAQHDYEGLGFKVSKGGHFPGGLSNCIVRFPNDGYLELLAVSGSKQGDAADIAEFV